MTLSYYFQKEDKEDVGPLKDRGCTDVICILIFIVFLGGMVGVWNNILIFIDLYLKLQFITITKSTSIKFNVELDSKHFED